MTNNRFIFALILCLLSLGSLAAAGAPPAPPPTTVTISDNFAPHGAFIRWDQFSTDLSASVANPPQSTTETTITGPTYNWAVVSQNPSSPTSTIIDSGNATLQSPIPSKSVCFVAGGGTYDVKVNCTITYTSTDNKTGVATPLGFSANPPLDVTFFVRVPIKALAYQTSQPTPLRGQSVPFDDGGPTPAPGYGQVTAYGMKVYDNQGGAYGNGVVVEEFSKAFDKSGHPVDPNGPAGGDAWTLNLADGTGTSVYTFQDGQGAWSRTPPVDYTSLAQSFQQTWHCMELTPPFNVQGANLYVDPGMWGSSGNGDNPPYYEFRSNVNNTTLNTQSLSVYFDHSVRQ